MLGMGRGVRGVVGERSTEVRGCWETSMGVEGSGQVAEGDPFPGGVDRCRPHERARRHEHRWIHPDSDRRSGVVAASVTALGVTTRRHFNYSPLPDIYPCVDSR